MAIIKSYSPLQNLSNYGTFITDANPNSDYFRITEFNETFTGGKNGFLIEGSEYLKETTEIKIEILDVEGNPIYYEPGNGVPEYYEGIAKLVSVHVYEDTPIGIGKITILGELKTYEDASGVIRDIPAEWSGAYNVKWEKTFQINKNLTNESRVRFYKRPLISIDEIVKPIFNVTTPFVTQSGSVEGISEIPIAGTNLSRWTAGTLYKLKRISGPGWTSSIDENVIDLPQINYTANIIEVLNTDEVLVDRPYTINNVVTNFTQSSYTSSFEYLDGQTFEESALTGSFAKIQISNLKTFVGDVARVKVFRKSRNDVGDYVLVQESKLESTELLRDLTASGQTDISFGNFTQTNLDTYWTGSANLLPTINVDKLYASVKPSNGQIGVQTLFTSQSVSVAKDVEYTLTFKTLYSGSVDNSKSLRAYLSSSDYTQEFITLSGSAIYQTKQDITQNIIAVPTSNLANAKLVFEFNGSGWHVSNVSLKNAQETSFSPDEFTIVQDVVKNVATETFDFRFEFYDINNNYIPVDVFATKTFTGGNNFITSAKLLTFESDRTAFRFSTGSFANPEFQQIGFKVTKQNLIDSVIYYSSAFDVSGNYISPGSYGGVYPGGFTSFGEGGATLLIDNFKGQLSSSVMVGSITYTASCEGIEEYETIYRFEDGENAPGLFATSTANQFIYKATDLSLNPLGQQIIFDVKRKNLASAITAITVNSTTGAPSLTLLSTDGGTGVSTYYLSGSDFPYNTGEVVYSFTASDNYGINYSDFIKITPVKILDGLSVNLSNENTTLPAKSTGFVESGSFVLTSGSVSVKVGGEDISRQEGLTTNNRWDIISATETNCIANDTTPDDATYGITSLTKDSGSLSLLVRYKDGAGDTTDVTKVVTYTKAKKAAPVVVALFSSDTQGIIKSNTGVYGTPDTFTIIVNEGSANYTYDDSVPYADSTFRITSISGGTGTTTITPTTPTTDAGTTVTITITYVNSEGTIGTITKTHRVSVATNGTDGTDGTDGDDGAPGANGGDGPGVVFRGPWSSTTTYNSVSQDPTRRDVVLYSGTYYATLSNATANLNKIPNTQTTFWQSLGTDSFFVAAEMIISKESYVQNTINVGTNSSGNANITIAGGTTSPYISIGQATKGYDQVGAFIGSNGTTGRLSLKSSTNSLTWDGAALGVVGTITSTSGNIGGFTLGGSQLYTGTKSSFASNDGGVYIGTDGIALGTNSPFKLTSAGALTASSGVIGGWTIGASSLTGGSATLSSSGAISIGSGNSIFKADGNGIYLGNATFGSAPFRVTQGGVLTASGVNISGAITATSGTFTGTVFASAGTFTGTVTATDGTFNGTINAALGNIGGWSIGATTLTSANDAVTLDSAGKKITIKNTAGAPSVIMSQASSFSSFGGSYTNSGNHGSANATGGSTPNTQTRLVASNAITAGGAPAGSSILFTVREKTSNGTTALEVSNGVSTLILTYIWFLRNTTTGQDIQIHRDSAGSYVSGTTVAYIGGFNSSSSITIAGSGHNWDLYQSTQWSYQGFGSTTASTILYPAGEWTAEQVTSFTEIIDGGIQTGNSPLRFVKLQRSAATNMIEVGGAITATDNITAYASDRRLKENIVPIDNALERVEQLNGVHYSWKDNVKQLGFQPSNLNDTGLFAQEVQAVLPNAVKLAPFDNNDGVSISGENYLTVQYEKVVPLLVEAIKELSAEIKELKKGR
jgi:hypothetical protein